MSDAQHLTSQLAKLAALGRKLADEQDVRRTRSQLTQIAFEALRLSLDDSQKAAKKSLARQSSKSSSARHRR